MITEEEKNEIINLAIERAMLMLPEVVGNLMTNHAMMNKMNSKFYSEHPEFKDKKSIVASVVEMVEGKNPLEAYDKILELSIPEIKKRIEMTKDLNMDKVIDIPNRDFTNANNGEL